MALSSTRRPPSARRSGTTLHNRRRARRAWLAVGLVLGTVLPVEAEDRAPAPRPTRRAWERIEGGVGRGADADSAVGDLAQGGLGRHVACGIGHRLAWSDVRGVARRSAGSAGSVERVALDGVTGLAFDGHGALWVASTSGLYLWREGGRPTRRRLPGGELANRVIGLTSDDGALLVATAAGAFWSPAPAGAGPAARRLFQALDTGGVSAPTLLTALRWADSSGVDATGGGASGWAEIWLLTRTGLERLSGLRRASGLRIVERDRWAQPRRGTGRVPLSLIVTREGTSSRLVLVYPDAVFHRRLGPVGAREQSAGRWQTERPVLVPGASIRRVRVDEAGAVVLASSSGLFESESLGATFSRASGDAGFASCDDLARGPSGRVYAICRSGLFRRIETSVGREGGAASDPVAPSRSGAENRTVEGVSVIAPRSPLPPDPPLAEIRRRALERAGLLPGRMQTLWRGLARRGLWPDLSLRFGAELDRDERRFADQSFVSGGLRDLLDRTRERGAGFEAQLALDWRLGEVAYPRDTVELSREQRQVVSLRDDIVDELHQLFFERARLRERLADPTPLSPQEERVLRQRAAELLAGLDAWTGGWLAAWHAAPDSRPSFHPRSPGPGSMHEREAQ